MIASAVVTGSLGLTASFLPDEIVNYIGLSANEFSVLFVQIIGALYLGFAIMNWMAKTVLIGGIYARPLAMGNCVHFTVASFALLKSALASSNSMYVWGITIMYAAFAILFGAVLFTSPKKALAKNV